MALESIMVDKSINIMILFKITRVRGVFLSLNAFLKSLIILLKVIALVLFDDNEEFATDIIFGFPIAPLAKECKPSKSEPLLFEFLEFI